ncbi:hypothetical protein DFJ77DRAFT_460936 [Powellomyces hirtus]|nr:hypothetical protein DFJ77DRAFT_460936 [Powellomyces hirtus]
MAPEASLHKTSRAKRTLLPAEPSPASSTSFSKKIKTESTGSCTALSPYDRFLSERRPLAELDNPQMTPAEVPDIMAQLWRDMPSQERMTFEDGFFSMSPENCASVPHPNIANENALPLPSATIPKTKREPAKKRSPTTGKHGRRSNHQQKKTTLQPAPHNNPNLCPNLFPVSRVAATYDEAGKTKSLGKSWSSRASSALFDMDLATETGGDGEQNVPH